jgi:hypothetical protein
MINTNTQSVMELRIDPIDDAGGRSSGQLSPVCAAFAYIVR